MVYEKKATSSHTETVMDEDNKVKLKLVTTQFYL